MTCPADCQRRCFYCDAPLLLAHEHDHMPVPARHNGTETVPACYSCHDLKDRVRLNDWPSDVLEQALAEAGPLGRIFIAKVYAIGLDRPELVAASPHTPATSQPPAA